MAEKTIINQIINYLQQEKINGIELASINLNNFNELKQENFLKNSKILIITDFSNNDKPFSISENELVEKMLNAISIENKDVEIIAIKKGHCHQFILEKIKKLMPKTIMIMGLNALKLVVSGAFLLKYENHWFEFLRDENHWFEFLRDKNYWFEFLRDRNHWFEFNGIDTTVTFHPKVLIKHPQYKKYAWKTLQEIKTKVN